jgi:hypothetical protein
MQTGIWMSYSDSMHFSNKLSYKILCISSYGLKDTNYTRFAYLQEFLEKHKIEEWNWARFRNRITTYRVGWI